MSNNQKFNLETFPIAIYESTPDKEREITFCNHFTRDFLGIDEKQIIYLNKFITPEHRDYVEEEIDQMIKSKCPIELRYKITTNTDKEIWLLDKISPILDENGKIISFHGVFDDITISQKAEHILYDYNEALKKGIEEKTFQLTIVNSELQKTNNLKDKFFSIIAHDLRSPFSGLINYTQILIDEIQSSNKEELEKSLELIHKSSKNVYNLMENLLTWSQLQTDSIKMHRETILLDHLIDDIVSPLKINLKLKKIDLAISIEDKSQAFADSKSVRTAIYNVLTNAIKFTPVNGRIEITTSVFGDYTFIEIKDSGIGISKEGIDNLFNLSEKKSREGTQGEVGSGLGLILTKEFIEKNEGKIDISSIENKGTTITLALPTRLRTKEVA